jgi:serine/threonine protein kinase
MVSNEEPPVEEKTDVVKLHTPRIRFKKLAKSEDESDDSSGSYDEGSHYAEFHDFPVQVTLLERADETLEDLSEEEFDDPKEHEERWTAWLFQIIAALSAAQHSFGFAHNDLHSNNVMWSETDQKFLHYRIHKGKDSYIMRVPTYGKLMKIIDFGRASYTLPDPGGFFISDAFYPGNDAAEQYNCEPFYDPKEGPRLEPNPSFDLCRLAISLLDSLFPTRPASVTPLKIMSREEGKLYSETVSPVYNLLWEWLQDDEGRNVLRNVDGSERYPQFDLYCALAKDVHKAIPKRQIEKPLFARFRGSAAADAPVYDLYI